MPRVSTQIPKSIYESINEEVKLGIFRNVSEAINASLKKTYAKKSREYLKWLMTTEDISEKTILQELKSIRK